MNSAETEPGKSYLLTQMAAGKSSDRSLRVLLLNFINGLGYVPSHEGNEETAPLAQRLHGLLEAYPELRGTGYAPESVRTDHPQVIAHFYGSATQGVLAAVNLSSEPAQITLWVPGMGSLLYDRLNDSHLPLAGGLVWLEISGYTALAYELR
jgi:glycosidase